MVTLKTVDRLVDLLIVGLILSGSYSWWQATRRARRTDGMMGQMMETMPGTDPIWYLFGTLIAVSVILGVYIISREQLAETISRTTDDGGIQSHDSDKSPPELATEQVESSMAEAQVSKQLSPLTFLPDDEQRVLEPILESPGLTQVELRGRSDFSKAKVSQAVSELEDRGLIYRERQGRTYRIYPGELLKDQDSS